MLGHMNKIKPYVKRKYLDLKSKLNSIISKRWFKRCPVCSSRIKILQLMGTQTLESCDCSNCGTKLTVDRKSIKVSSQFASIFAVVLGITVSSAFLDLMAYQIISCVLIFFFLNFSIFAYNFYHINFLHDNDQQNRV